MSEAESKRAIEQALQAFITPPLKAATTRLFNALGYASKKALDLKPNGIEGSGYSISFLVSACPGGFA